MKDRTGWLTAIAVPIGLEVGSLSAGAGALGTAALMHLTSLSTAEVVGTDLCFGLIISFVGGGVHFLKGQLNSETLLYLILGGIPGALIGAEVASRLPSKLLRKGLAVWLIYLGIRLFLHGYSTIVH